MRYRDRWERWLLDELASQQPPKGVSRMDAFAVAQACAMHADADGTSITVKADTLRRKFRAGKPKIDQTLAWLVEIGVVVVVTKHGRDAATRRALAIPAPDDEQTPDSPITKDDEGTTGGPLKTMLNGPVTGFERTSNRFDRTTGSPQPIDQEATRGDAREARDDPSPTPQLPESEPPRRCAEHRDQEPGRACGACKGARLDWERWQRSEQERAARPPLPPVCGQCDARDDDAPAARMVSQDGRLVPCPRCHPKAMTYAE